MPNKEQYARKKRARSTLKLRKETIMQYRCPHCGAGPGEGCYTYAGHGQRTRMHKERVEHAQSVIGTLAASRH